MATTKSETVKVRLKSRMLKSRSAGVDEYFEAGDVVDVPRPWAEKLLARTLTGYPSAKGNANEVGKLPGDFRDSPIELVDEK